MRTAREEALEQALAVLSADERATLSGLHERMLAGLTSDRASARRLCRLCDVDACGHHRGTCPVTAARRRPTLGCCVSSRLRIVGAHSRSPYVSRSLSIVAWVS